MALQIIKPYIHVEDANGNPYVGAKLYVYLPGTTTPAAIFSDAALSVALPNPLTGASGSDAAGNFPRAYIAAGSYKLRAETSAGVLIWQEDNIDTGLSSGSGALPIASGGTGATTATAALASLGAASSSDVTALSSTIAALQTTLQGLITVPQGYLTLTTATPVITADVIAGTSVYYTPYIGNLIPIYDGTQFNTKLFAELTLTLNANHTASNLYDVFVFNNAGVVTIGTGPAWNTATIGAGARGTGAGTTELTRSKGGLYTNANAMTARNGATTYAVAVNQGTYVGSLYMDGTNGQITCHRAFGQLRKWGVWNAYNRVPIILSAGDATSNWTYNTATWRASRNDANNAINVFTGLAEEQFDIVFHQQGNTSDSNSTSETSIGIGWNSTTATSGKTGDHRSNLGVVGAFNQTCDMVAAFAQVPALGVNQAFAVENGRGSNSANFSGTSASMLLKAVYRG